MVTSKSDQLRSADGGSSNFWSHLKLVGFTIWLMLYSIYYAIIFVYDHFFPSEQPKLNQNEIILVTGGANGIGREICLKLADLNKSITIIIWDVNEEANAVIIKELKARGLQKCYGFKVDVSNRVQVDEAAEKIRQEIGDVTCLFNNAGILGEIRAGWEMNPEVVQKTYDINIVSHCWTLKAFLPAMIKKGSGHVVETCSVAGFLTGPNIAPYIASKHAVKGYIECIKEDIRILPNKPQIHFTLVYPHVIQTAMARSVDYKTSHPSLVPQISPAHVASKVVDGMLRNQEHVYIPGSMRAAAMFLSLLPPPVVRKMIDFLDIDMKPAKTQ